MDKIFTGKTIEDALKNACDALGVSQENLFYEIVEYPSKGFLGIGGKPASIKVPDTSSPEDYISTYLKDLFLKMGVSDYDENIEINENIINIQLDGEEIGYYTKKNTDIVDSLQFLLAVSVNKAFDGNYKVTLNINDYKQKSASRLETLAVKTAKQVLRTKKKVTLGAMSPYQRRIVHSRLHEFENITTFSIGTEPNRKVVVAYDGPDKPLVRREDGTPETGRRNAGSAPARRNGGRSSSERGGGKPFNPGALGHNSRPPRRREERPSAPAAPKVEKIKVLYPGPGADSGEKSDFDAE